MRLARAEPYVNRAAAVAYQLLQPSLQIALGPAYPAYKLGEYALGSLDRKVLGSKTSGTKAAVYQALTFDFTGLALNLAGVGKKRGYSDLATDLNHAHRSCSEGNCSPERMRTLLQRDPFGVPFLLSAWDVLGSKRQLDRRIASDLKDPNLRSLAISNARRFPAALADRGAFTEQAAAWYRRI